MENKPKSAEVSFDLYWPCACVKRGRNGRITALKMNPHNRIKCPTCKGTKAIADSVKSE